MLVDRQTRQTEIDSNLEYFLQILPQVLPSHRDRYALLRHREVIDYFDTANDTLIAAKHLFPDGIYSIQKVSEKPINLGIFANAVHLG